MPPHLHPPLIQRRALLIEPQVARQPDPAQLVLVLGRSVDHIRLVENHIASLIITDQPPQFPTRPHPSKLLGVMRQEPILTHEPIERIDTLLRTQPLRIPPELSLHLLAELTAAFEVHQAAARRPTVPDRDPRGEELGVAGPEEQFVVVDAGAAAAGAVVPQHGAVDEDFRAPAHQVPDEGAEGGVGEEAAVGGCRVGGVEEGEGRGVRGAAEALVREGVVGRVEDAVAGGGGGEEDAGGGELLEIAGGF